MRNCKQCSKPLPRTAGHRALYCCGHCRNRASYLRNVHACNAKDIRSEADRYKLVKRLESEAITARHLRELRPVTERYNYPTPTPYLGAEFQII
jgi:hypothetical protein